MRSSSHICQASESPADPEAFEAAPLSFEAVFAAEDPVGPATLAVAVGLGTFDGSIPAAAAF